MSRRTRTMRTDVRAEIEALSAEMVEDQALDPSAARELARLALAPLRLMAQAWDAAAELNRPVAAQAA